MILSGASGTGKSTALTQLSVRIFAWRGDLRGSREPR
jgi:predicted ATPase